MTAPVEADSTFAPSTPAAPLQLSVRFYRLGTELDVPCEEERFAYCERTLDLPLHQTALVLVDVWNMHYCASYLQRSHQITCDAIAPALAVARRIGMVVVHAPSPPVARRYPQWTRYADDADLFPVGTATPDWPPADFRARQNNYAAYGRYDEPHIAAWKEPYKHMLIASEVAPLPEEYVIATGNQLHRLLHDQGVVHLIYAGFATNFCLPGRDYGMKAFRNRGYNLVLLRDCTTAVEFHDTVSESLVTRLWTRDLEMQGSCFTATSAQFQDACTTAVGD